MCRFVEERKIEDRWADSNIFRMLERVRFIGSAYDGEERLDSWFKKDFDRSVYRFFNMAQHTESFLNEDMIKRISGLKGIYIYGAGQIARRVYPDIIRNTDTVIKAFLVSKYDSDYRSLAGIPVIEYDPDTIDRDTPVLVSVGKALRTTICELLERDGIKWMYYR